MQAFEEHRLQLSSFAYGLARDRDVAEDLVQESFLRLVRELNAGRTPDNVKAWLFRVAYNEALAVRRRQAVGDKANRFLAENLRPDESGPEVDVSQAETVAAVRAALNELPAEQRQVVALRIYEQRRFAEIAEQLRLPLGTVLSRMQLALQKLRRSLKGHGDDAAEE